MTKINKWHEPDAYELSQRAAPDIFPSLHVWGHTFSPNRLSDQTGFRAFAEANEPNEINVAGPYRGRTLGSRPGYGAAIIRPPESLSSYERLSWMVEKILAGHTRKFCKEFGIVESCMYLTVYYSFDQECCLVLPAHFLHSLRDMPVVISSVQSPKPPDPFAN